MPRIERNIGATLSQDPAIVTPVPLRSTWLTDVRQSLIERGTTDVDSTQDTDASLRCSPLWVSLVAFDRNTWRLVRERSRSTRQEIAGAVKRSRELQHSTECMCLAGYWESAAEEDRRRAVAPGARTRSRRRCEPLRRSRMRRRRRREARLVLRMAGFGRSAPPAPSFDALTGDLRALGAPSAISR